MSHFGQIHNDDPFWYADDTEARRRESEWPVWLAILIMGIVIGLITWSCINAAQNPPEAKTVPVGSPG